METADLIVIGSGKGAFRLPVILLRQDKKWRCLSETL